MSAEEAAVLVALPRPDVHVRWAVPKIQPKRNATSIPGDRGEQGPKAARGKSQAPPCMLSMGCWGECARCNHCSRCRRRICNGGCSACKNCRKCREWGRVLGEGGIAPKAKQAEMELLPEVAKRQAKDPGNKAKHAAAAAYAAMRPKSAPPGSRLCPYCEKWLPHSRPENCPSMPFPLWIDATRQRSVMKHGQATVDSWKVCCQHCGTPFPSFASKRVHLSGCERRRREADLPLDQFPVVRP